MTVQPHTLQAEFWFIVLTRKLLLSGSGYLALVVGWWGSLFRDRRKLESLV